MVGERVNPKARRQSPVKTETGCQIEKSGEKLGRFFSIVYAVENRQNGIDKFVVRILYSKKTIFFILFLEKRYIVNLVEFDRFQARNMLFFTIFRHFFSR